MEKYKNDRNNTLFSSLSNLKAFVKNKLNQTEPKWKIEISETSKELKSKASQKNISPSFNKYFKNKGN